MKNKKESNCLFHTWRIVRDNGSVAYRRCKACGERDIKRYSRNMLAPIEQTWIKEGTFVAEHL